MYDTLEIVHVLFYEMPFSKNVNIKKLSYLAGIIVSRSTNP